MASGSGKQTGAQPQGSEGTDPDNASVRTVFIPPAARGQSTPATGRSPEPAIPTELFEKGARLEGQTIGGRYRVESWLAYGATGEVFRAMEIDLERPVALKLITPAFTRDNQLMEVGTREVRLLSRISHPAVVQYYAAGHDQPHERHWIAMEFVEGTPLSDAIKDHRFAEDEVLALFRILADGLRAAHAHDIIHRDVVPSNIILRRGDPRQPVLIDFGIARLRQASEERSTIVGNGFQGTLAYAAPETFGMYDGRIGPWTDIFSLGAVIYEAALGRRAFSGSSLADAVEARRTLPDLSVLSPTLREILTRMLEPDPRKRVRNLDDLTNRPAPEPRPVPSSMSMDFGAPPPVATASRHGPGFLGRLLGRLSMGGPHGPGGGEDD
ncbi:MAG: serine/threonine-protein kinase [Pseudomonadota bacterium]